MDDTERRRKRAEYMRQWMAQRTPEQVIADGERSRAYRERNRERERQRAAQWYANNREQALERQRANYVPAAPGGKAEANNPLWKGDAVGYDALHRWVSRYKGKPRLCEHCGTTAAKRYDWANVDHKYRRNLDDYIRLCAQCHATYDYSTGIRAKRQPRA